MDMITPWTNKINLIFGAITAALSYLLGDHWVLFVAFFALNVTDYITGCLKSKINNKINSKKGAAGILKKLGYWIMIMVAFGMNVVFMEIGSVMGLDLQVTSLIGWSVLATLAVNEFRSILENFVEAGYNLPTVLIKGLEIANKALEKTEKDKEE